MVIQKIVKQYECPYCNISYTKRSNAEDCADNCNENDEVIEITVDSYKCEMCNKFHPLEEEAKKCESKHKKEKDSNYDDYLIMVEKKKLELASKHPSQKKLGNI